MKTTILGGALFLVPLAFVAIVLTKAYEVALLVAKPIDKYIPIEHVGGIALANILAIVLILLICYIAGLAARGKIFADKIGRIDNLLMDLVPGYAVLKSMLTGLAQGEDKTTLLKPVLVRLDDFDQLAFEVERNEEKAVIFLPGSPSAWSGSSVLVDLDRVTSLDLAPHQVSGLLRVMGRGTVKLKQKTQL